MNEFDAVTDAIAAGDLDTAVQRLRVLAKPVSQQLADRVLGQSQRLAHVGREGAEGRMTAEALRVERMGVTVALLGLLRELEAAARQTTKSAAVTDAEVFSALRQLEAGVGSGPLGEAINGINNLKSISWLEDGVRAARSVCRVLVPSADGTGYGSGFLIAPGRVMTNNHVIGSKEQARKAQLEFSYQLFPDGSGDTTVRYDLDPDTFFHTSPEHQLDFTVVAVRPAPDKPPLEKWGVLSLNADAVPLARDLVPVIQHPNAQVKQVALTASAVVQVKPPFLHYTTDTLPGSSGSPVFNDLWQVVAIHRASGPQVGAVQTNEGVLMSSVRPHLGAHWPGKSLPAGAPAAPQPTSTSASPPAPTGAKAESLLSPQPPKTTVNPRTEILRLFGKLKTHQYGKLCFRLGVPVKQHPGKALNHEEQQNELLAWADEEEKLDDLLSALREFTGDANHP